MTKWTIDVARQEQITIREGVMTVATIPGYGTGERLQRANLIAAAPELYEALQEMLGWQTLAPEGVVKRAHTALDAAKGD